MLRKAGLFLLGLFMCMPLFLWARMRDQQQAEPTPTTTVVATPELVGPTAVALATRTPTAPAATAVVQRLEVTPAPTVGFELPEGMEIPKPPDMVGFIMANLDSPGNPAKYGLFYTEEGEDYLLTEDEGKVELVLIDALRTEGFDEMQYGPTMVFGAQSAPAQPIVVCFVIYVKPFAENWPIWITENCPVPPGLFDFSSPYSEDRA